MPSIHNHPIILNQQPSFTFINSQSFHGVHNTANVSSSKLLPIAILNVQSRSLVT